MAKKAADDGSLKRLGGGRWQTRDERFTIEPESGTWVVLDAEQTDDLGLPLVRGPFGSLNAAKLAIADARESVPAVSPLAAKVAEHRDRPATAPSKALRPHVIEVTPPKARPAPPAETAPRSQPPPRPEPPEPIPAPLPPEPKWILALTAAERRRAHELVERLRKAGAPDPEATAEREIAGKEPALAEFAVGRAIERLGPKAAPAAVARLLADGEAADLGVRWRLVDGDGRQVPLKEVLK
jgi:hypothetical protein